MGEGNPRQGRMQLELDVQIWKQGDGKDRKETDNEGVGVLWMLTEKVWKLTSLLKFLTTNKF